MARTGARVVVVVLVLVAALVALVVVVTPSHDEPLAGADGTRGEDVEDVASRRTRRHARAAARESGDAAGNGAGSGSDDEMRRAAPSEEEEVARRRAELAAERARREAAVELEVQRASIDATIQPEDDGLTVLRRYLEFDADVSGLVTDHAAMRAHVRVESGPIRSIVATGERTAVDLTEVAAGHAVLEFGEGVFVLDRGTSGWNVRRDVIESLEIRGAGMDRTKLVGPGWAFLCASEKGAIRNLVIRDLTIDSVEQGQIVLDARGGIAAALERVRIAGWVVAGHAAPLGVTGNAFLACQDCEFLGSGDGFVLSLRGPGLASFERCRFVDAGAALIADSNDGKSALVQLTDCSFENIRLCDRDLRSGDTGGARVAIRGGTAAIGASGWEDGRRREHFRADNAASVEGLTFTSARPLFAVSDARNAFAVAAGAGLRDIVRLEVRPGVPGKPVELDFYVQAGRAGEPPVRRRRIYDGTALAVPEEEPRRSARNVSEIPREDLARVLPLWELIQRAGLAEDEDVSGVSLRGGEGRVTCLIQLASRGGHVVLDAATAEELFRSE